MASDAPPSLPPIEPTPYDAASINEIPKPSTDFFSILVGIRNKFDVAINANFKFSSIFFKKTASFFIDNSCDSFIKLFSSSPKPILIYLIFGNLGFKFFINIKILSCPFLLSSLATVIIFGKESLKTFSASVLNTFSIIFGFLIP